MKKIYATLLYLLFNSAIAQPGKEAWHWNFGDGWFIDFSTGGLTGTSPLKTLEGSASISDANTGQLLFFTDGDTVWDRNNNIMANGLGLLGNFSSTQSALIVPKPGSQNLYYLVSADQGGYFGPNQGVHYSVVDMNLNGGLGDVSSKNILLTPPPTTEKLIAVKHCNGYDYWIITHPFFSNAFYAYLVTSTGINPVPVISHAGTIEKDKSSGSFFETIGYLKASPNGKKLALGISYYIPIAEIFDFDNTTGTVTNPITIDYSAISGEYGAYGISFSPDNSKLYTSISQTGSLFQYDLNAGTSAAIIASRKFIANVPYIGALQLSPLGQLYIASSLSYYLSVISYPDSMAANCAFTQGGVYFNSYSTSFGLPNFIDATTNYSLHIPDITQCKAFVTDTLDAGPGFLIYNWSTGVNTQTITITQPGTYWVSVLTSTGCIATDTVKTFLVDPAAVKVLSDTAVCTSNGQFTFSASYPGTESYLWNDGTTNPVNTIFVPGSYSVNYTFNSTCQVTNDFSVSLKQVNLNISLPNIVTSNNDEINDEIDFGKFGFTSLQIEIYNRWGNLIFESKDPSCIWKPIVEDGIYFYAAKYHIDCGLEKQERQAKGFITVMK